MRVLALEPYFGGSHRAFLEGWSQRSRHLWTLLTLPPHKWKWRMRHAAITFAGQVADAVGRGESWDRVLCSDMLNLAEFLGLAPAQVRALPTVAYFHENQLTYPVRHEDERDYHFVLTNLTTALAADGVWFNSAYHRDEFLGALPEFLRRMPDHQPLGAVDIVCGKSHVHPPGVADFPQRGARAPGPLRILWAARWEHDKNPEDFFEALRRLQSAGVDFRLSVVGERFRECPAVFDEARVLFASHTDRWGYQPSLEDYRAALVQADVVVSTANHEFFGISVVEAVAAGAYPLLPRRLSYPELLSAVDDGGEFFYDGDPDCLAGRLTDLAGRLARGSLWGGDPRRAARAVERFNWSPVAERLDQALEKTG